MKRAVGIVLLAIGITPVAGLLVWVSGMYIVGFAFDLRAAAFALADIACIGIGLHLIWRSN